MPAKKDTIKEQLAAILAEEAPPTFLLVDSTDSVRRERILDTVLDKFFSTDQLSPTVVKGGELKSAAALQQLESSLLATSLFSPQTLVIVKNTEDIPADKAAALVAIIKKLPEGSTLICCAKSLPAKNKLYALAKKQDVLLKTIPLKGTELANWIQRELKQQGIKRAPKNVVQGIATICDGSIDKAVAMIEHCALYSANGDVTYKDFEALYPEAPEQNEFALIDLLQNGSPADIDIALQRLWQNGKNAFMFLGLLNRTYTRYLTIRTLLDAGHAPGQIRHTLGMNEWVFNKHLNAVRKRPLERLEADLAALLRADSLLKNKSLGQAEVIAELAGSLSR